jgi:hypothetical protein
LSFGYLEKCLSSFEGFSIKEGNVDLDVENEGKQIPQVSPGLRMQM